MNPAVVHCWSMLVAAGAVIPSAAERPAEIVIAGEVSAPATEVWQALTTPEGVTTFFAEDALVESRIGGAYEMYFLPDNPVGLRGTEGIRILAMEEPHRFFTSWNAPTRFPAQRDQQTVVEFELLPIDAHRTLVAITHSGWGRGEEWQQVREYFNSAWPVILGQLQYRFDHGPIDWNDRPDGAAYFRPAAVP